MSPLIDRNGCRTQNPKWKRYDRWLIQRYFPRTHTYTKQWKVIPPIDPVSDFCDVKYFKTHEEAIAYANREWLKRQLLWDFEAFLEDDQNRTCSPDFAHTGLDTMLRTLKWWGKFDLADMLENI